MTKSATNIPPVVMSAYGIERAEAERLSQGLINQTWIVTSTSDAKIVVQKLHRAISAEANARIEGIARHLNGKGVRVPNLIATTDREKSFSHDGQLWRALEFVPGVAYDAVEDPVYLQRAGFGLGRFHVEIQSLDDVTSFPVSAIHQLSTHTDRLEQALSAERDHRLYRDIEPVADRIFRHIRELDSVAEPPLRLVHGDPKISNFLFDDATDTIAIVDLDTVARMPLIWELGDAFRSWCNAGGEDDGGATFSINAFNAALSGYAKATRTFIQPEEVAGIVLGTQTIAVELATRFCVDALEESYFGWDDARYDSAAHHNLARARSQLILAEDIARKRDAAEHVVRECFER